MAALNSIAKAIAEDYDRAQLVTWRKAAIEAHMADLPRVEITGANFDAGGTVGQYLSGKPERVIELCTAAIDFIDQTAKRNRNQMIGDFSQRRVGW